MPEVILLDSHVWYWWVISERQRLSPSILSVIENVAAVGVSPVSCYEIATAIEVDSRIISLDSQFRHYPELANRLLGAIDP